MKSLSSKRLICGLPAFVWGTIAIFCGAAAAILLWGDGLFVWLEHALRPLTFYIRQEQVGFYKSLSQGVSAIQADGSLFAIFSLVGISFLYGLFHAMGPGHGKAVISTYVLTNKVMVRKTYILSMAAAFMQAISAITLVFLALGIFELGNRWAVQTTEQVLEPLSFAAVSVLGAYIVWRSLRKLAQVGRANLSEVSAPASDHHHHASHDHHHHESEDHAHTHRHNADGVCGCGHKHGPSITDVAHAESMWQMLGLVVSIGMRPCSGALIVLIAAHLKGLTLIGVLAVFAMAVGTGLTVASLATGVHLVRLPFAYWGQKAGARGWIARFLPYAGAWIALLGGLLLVTLGGLLVWDALQAPVHPFAR